MTSLFKKLKSDLIFSISEKRKKKELNHQMAVHLMFSDKKNFKALRRSKKINRTLHTILQDSKSEKERETEDRKIFKKSALTEWTVINLDEALRKEYSKF